MKVMFLGAIMAMSLPVWPAVDYGFNQNYNFNKYINEGSWTFLNNYNQDVKLEMKRESAGYKDLEGNEVSHLHFTGKDFDFYLVPENPFYPLWYHMVSKHDMANRAYHIGMKDIDKNEVYIVLNDNCIKMVEIREGIPMPEEKQDYKRFGMSVSNWDNVFQRITPKSRPFFDIVRGKGKGSPYSDWMDFKKNYALADVYAAGSSCMTQYPGLPKYYEMVKKYQDKVLENAKTKGYTALLNEVTEGDHILYCQNTYHTSTEFLGMMDGYVRIKFEKKDGKIVRVMVQNAFTDGKFYDKEKFFIPVDLYANGKVKIGGYEYHMIPFEGRLMFAQVYNGTVNNPIAIIGPARPECFTDFLALGNFGNNETTDQLYFCNTELESSYDAAKDHYTFRHFLQRYATALGIK